MTEDRLKFRKGMLVKIDSECEFSRKFYEFTNPKKLSLLGKLKKIQEAKEISISRWQITIENWYFDDRDLKIIVTEDDVVSGDPTQISKNKKEKPKIYFNPEQL
jgi:hypothetical protein